MSQLAILYPVFVQVALTFVLMFRMAFARRSDLVSRRVHPKDIALGQSAWPEPTLKVSNSFGNQFEVPVLFYLLAVLCVVTRLGDLVLVTLAWVFVITRIAHAYIHTSGNIVMRRGAAFGLGVVVLLVMWIWFLVRFMAAAA